VFVNGAVVGVGDSPSDLATIALTKFPDYPFVMKFKGKLKPPMEYVYMSLTDGHVWKYVNFFDHTYPMLKLTASVDANIKNETEPLNLGASIDTAATVCVLRDDLIPPDKLKLKRKELVSTAAGIIQSPIYTLFVQILDHTFEIECITAPIPDQFPFKFLIGRNLLDQLDAYLLGKKQVLMLKMAS
jgi:hypothetical protein